MPPSARSITRSSTTTPVHPKQRRKLDKPLNKLHLADLNEDVLLLILAELHQIRERWVDQTCSRDHPHHLNRNTRKGHCELTALQSLSMTNHYFRNLAYPILSRSLEIHSDWQTVERPLTFAVKNKHMFNFTRTLCFNITVGIGGYNDGRAPSEELKRNLVMVLQSIPRLNSLEFVLPEHQPEIIEAAFVKRKLSLPTVETVVVGPFCDFVVRFCPNASSVSSNGWVFDHSRRATYKREHVANLIHSAGSAPFSSKITHFKLDALIDDSALQNIQESLPQLKSLALPIGMTDNITPLDLLPILSTLEELEELVLPSLENLNVGYDPPRYRSDGQQRTERARKEEAAKQEFVVSIAFELCKRLKICWISPNKKAICSRYQDGNVEDIRWG